MTIRSSSQYSRREAPSARSMIPDAGRLRDEALLDLIDSAIAIARDRHLDDELVERLGETVREMMVEKEGRKAAIGLPSLFEALPSVIEARSVAYDRAPQPEGAA